MNLINTLFHSHRALKNLVLIILAAVLLLLIFVAQQFFTRQLLEDELDKRAESELVLKSILVKSMLRTAEKTVSDHLWDIRNSLENPDSVFEAAKWLLHKNQYLEGAGMGFVPNYYPQKGRLFEPYAQEIGGEIITRQIAGDDHDYTRHDFYRVPLETQKPYWSEPYIDSVSRHMLICSYSLPVTDLKNDTAGVFCIDMSLEWLSDTLDVHHIYPSSFNLLITEDGNLITRPAPSDPKAHDVEQVLYLINDSTASREQSSTNRSNCIKFTSKADHAKGYIYYANMRGKPHWQVAVVCYDDEVYGNLHKMTYAVMLAVLGALLLLGFIIMRFFYNERKLHQASVAQERISSELRIANQIQQSMLPHSRPSAKLHDDIDVSGSLTPAKEVGGDLYDFIIRNEKLYFCIGDVSGKGVPSSLVMAVAQALFHAGSQHMSNPEGIMQNINHSICRNNERDRFVTFFVGVLDIPTGRMRYCNAGHDTPMLVTDVVEPLAVKSNLPVGIIADFKYEVQEYQFTPDTTLFLYTDGLTEAMDQEHHQFGRQRMQDALKQGIDRKLSTGELLQEMTARVHQFTAGAEQSDDLTMLAIHYAPHDYQDVLDEQITLKNDVKQIPQLNSFVEHVTDQLGLDSTLSQQMKLAVEEAVVNVMQYAYPAGTTGDVTITAKSNGMCLKFIITDAGNPFDPTEAAKADTTLSVEERPIGGLGIFLVREMMDSINYERFDGKNILTLSKYYNNQTNKKNED
ncbi:MAG: SpoIIE family protein phosphatase [Muribaculaceae bacterium]|nr:SpoIIE family protein phosphatase [Muribaculaceae bacterium]